MQPLKSAIISRPYFIFVSELIFYYQLLLFSEHHATQEEKATKKVKIVFLDESIPKLDNSCKFGSLQKKEGRKGWRK